MAKHAPGRVAWIAAAAAGVVTLAVVAAFFVRPDRLELRDRDGRVVGLFPASRGFALYQLHSVEKQPWIDRFRVVAGAMVLYRTEYKGLGAGLPSGDEGGTVTLQGGWIVIDGLHREWTRIVLGPSEIGQPRIMVGSETWDLWLLAAGRGPLSLEVVRVPLARQAGWWVGNAGMLARARTGAPQSAGTGNGVGP